LPAHIGTDIFLWKKAECEIEKGAFSPLLLKDQRYSAGLKDGCQQKSPINIFFWQKRHDLRPPGPAVADMVANLLKYAFQGFLRIFGFCYLCCLPLLHKRFYNR
jgi:hypothetical protein